MKTAMTKMTTTTQLPTDLFTSKAVQALESSGQRVFEHPNLSDLWRCKICKTSKDAPVTLVGLPWTQRGDIEEAEQVHAVCWWLMLYMRDMVEFT